MAENPKTRDAGTPPEQSSLAAPPAALAAEKSALPPSYGEVISMSDTKNTYTIGQKIGEGGFGIVFSCTDGWNNELAAKVLKPFGTGKKIAEAARAEFAKLLTLRHPNITFVYDAFEYRDTFHIVTERCYGPLTTTLF
jgi:eukaryotic-like serine/threonine-protein kinase